MLKFWSVNYICQVCKLYFYYGHVRNLHNIYISVFSINSESALLLALVKYMLCSHFTQHCIFCSFWRLENPCFVTKNCWKLSYICVFILSKKRRNWFHKSLRNSGRVGRRKLPDPSLNHIFNVLSIGEQYTLSFQLTNFGLKCLILVKKIISSLFNFRCFLCIFSAKSSIFSCSIFLFLLLFLAELLSLLGTSLLILLAFVLKRLESSY